MKKMKKNISSRVCVLTMVFAMTACGNTNDEEGKTSSTATESTNSSENNNAASEDSASKYGRTHYIRHK